MLKRILAGSVLAGMLSIGAFYATSAEACACGGSYYDPTAKETSTPGCYVFDLDQPNISQDMVDRMLASGYWHGVAGDGKEALYNGVTCW